MLWRTHWFGLVTAVCLLTASLVLTTSCASHLSRGIKHFKHNHFDLAAVELQSEVEKGRSENRAEALYYLAQVYGARGQYQETCETLYQAALLTLVKMTKVSAQAGNRSRADRGFAVERIQEALTERDQSRREHLIKRSLDELSEGQREELEGMFAKLEFDRLYKLLKSINGKLALFGCKE